MSKLSQELKTLFYLNQRYSRTKLVTINEIAEYLEISPRQARRYIEDLLLINDINIQTKVGRDGGYRLVEPLKKEMTLPENLVLALSLAMKRNEHIETILSEIPQYVISDYIDGDNRIDNATYDNLEKIFIALKDQKEINFQYKNFEEKIYVQPYKIVLTNHTYYLYAVDNDKVKKYDVIHMKNITKLGSFKQNDEMLNQIQDDLSRYGIKSGVKTELRVKCKNIEVLNTFNKYFEGKGKMDIENLTYSVLSNSENELYYPLFRISTKDYEILNKEFKEKYIKYLESVTRSIK